MEQALEIIKEMLDRSIIKDCAIGGGVAATYYIEPVLTYDLDVFFIPMGTGGLDLLGPIYAFAAERGFPAKAEAIVIGGFPVQFIPAYNDLVREAVSGAAILKYRGVEAKVVTAEYLAAIALQTGRAKDRERLARLLEEADLDRNMLMNILNAHGLSGKFKKFEEQSRE